MKALYRRSLASKWLGRLDVALRGLSDPKTIVKMKLTSPDVEEVLKLEPENEAASIEVEELRGLKWKQEVNVRLNNQICLFL